METKNIADITSEAAEYAKNNIDGLPGTFTYTPGRLGIDIKRAYENGFKSAAQQTAQLQQENKELKEALQKIVTVDKDGFAYHTGNQMIKIATNALNQTEK